MEANELRIGNFIGKGAVYCKVNSIHVVEDHPKKEWHVRVSGFSKDNQHCFFGNDIEPIPLTEEWLVRFGFELAKSGWHYLENCPYELTGGVFTFRLERRQDFYFSIDLCIGRKIKYVHHLQNFYFEITGEELKLKS